MLAAPRAREGLGPERQAARRPVPWCLCRSDTLRDPSRVLVTDVDPTQFLVCR